MIELASFGNPARFEVAVRWLDDAEPRGRRPAHGGWSTGEIRLTVAHHVLTRNQFGDDMSDTVKWYLLPVFEWLAENWVSLLHEERFAWRDNSAAPAATTVFLALRRLIDAGDDAQDDYAGAQAWWSRHALRSADPSALYPDLVFRRLRDEIEVSWTARQPVYSPDGFRFTLGPGAATMPVSDVAGPLWEALNWVAATAPAMLSSSDRASIEQLEAQISTLRHLPTARLESRYLPEALFKKVNAVREKLNVGDNSERLEKIPAIAKLDDAVLMFGGVNPNIGSQDIGTLLALLASNTGDAEIPELRRLVDDGIGSPLAAPFEEGYDLAEQLLETFSLPGKAAFIDVREILDELRVGIVEKRLKTSTIRGVAIAGSGYSPVVVINKTSDYNSTDTGKRFTLAHELFHLLYDRTRARRVAHISGPWAPPGIEKRANAFAAMFLMPRSLLHRFFFPRGKIDVDTVLAAANSMRVGVSALVEHLYNTSMIDEFMRDHLRGHEAASRDNAANKAAP